MALWRKRFFRSVFLKRNSLNNSADDAEKGATSTFEEKIEKLIGYKPTQWNVFHECFTHSSIHDGYDNKNFERLEFLGDAILGSIVSDYLYRQAPNEKEGYLTQMRSKMVNRKSLNALGAELRLTRYLHKRNNTNLGENINGNLYEALIGAVYIDSGFEICRDFISKTLIKTKDYAKLEKKVTSYKSLIIEWGQKNKQEISFNTLQEENAEDVLIFDSIVRVNDKVIAKGRATSKKKAEENAARRAYYSLSKHLNPKKN